MRHLVIGQRQKAPNFSAFHWSPRSNLVSIGQHFVITRVVHLPKKDQNKLNYRIGPLRSDSVIELVSDLITESDQAVRAMHSCNSWFFIEQCFCGLRVRTYIFDTLTIFFLFAII